MKLKTEKLLRKKRQIDRVRWRNSNYPDYPVYSNELGYIEDIYDRKKVDRFKEHYFDPRKIERFKVDRFKEERFDTPGWRDDRRPGVKAINKSTTIDLNRIDQFCVFVRLI